MIIDAKSSSVELIGDIQEFKTGIDPKNLEFITTLLSSNLYSNPEQSFIREIVSNAWDSHVEAGTTDTPVIVKFDYAKNSITIRDYGIGLSPDRFKDIFCNIGSSTKRESNDYIGGFGIGRFSALACTNTVYITSYYNGKAYYYIMIKDGNAITSNLVNTIDTEENNGVAITIENIYNYTLYEEALKYIVFFPNVYLDASHRSLYTSRYNPIIDKFNTTQIKKFKYYASTSSDIDTKILLGNVLYPLASSILTVENKLFYNSLIYSGIVIRFSVGELDITPNRESIIYSTKCKDIINQRFKEARNELTDHIKSLIITDYNDLFEWRKAMISRFSYDPIAGDVKIAYRNFMFNPKDYGINFTYKGKNLGDLHSIIGYLDSIFLPNFKGAIESDKIRTAIKNTNGRKYCSLASDKIIMLKGTTRMTSAVKEFLIDNYMDTAVTGEFTKDSLLLKLVSHKVISSSEEYKKDFGTHYIIDELYDYIMAHTTVLDVTTDRDFLKFKEDLAKDNFKSSSVKQLHLWVYETWCGAYTERTFNTLDEAIAHIKSIPNAVYICPYSEDTETSHHYVARNLKNVTIIKCANTLFNKLIPIKFTNRIDIYDLIIKDTTLRKIKTLSDYSYLFVTRDEDILLSIPEPLKSQIEDLIKLYKNYNSKYATSCRHLETLNLTNDSYVEEICKKYKEYINAYSNLKEEYLTEGVFLFMVINKLKKYRISYTAYQEIKSNKLLQLLCKK